MSQIVIVYIIGALVALLAGYKLYRLFFRRQYNSVCNGCPIGKECAKAKDKRKECGRDVPTGKGRSCCH